MEKQNFIPFLVLAVLVPLLFSPESISAIDLQDQKFKLIVNFDYNGNPNTLRGSYQQDVAPLINGYFDDMGLNTFDKVGEGAQNNPNGYSYNVYNMAFQPVGVNPMSNDAVFQIYPLVRVTGDKPTLTDSEFNFAKNVLMAQQRTAIVDFLQVQGATNVQTYIHFSYGGLTLDEGF